MTGRSPKERRPRKRQGKSALKLTKDPFRLSTPFLKRSLRARGATTAPISSIPRKLVRSLRSKKQGTSTLHSSTPTQSLSQPIVITANIGGIEIEDLLVDG